MGGNLPVLARSNTSIVEQWGILGRNRRLELRPSGIDYSIVRDVDKTNGIKLLNINIHDIDNIKLGRVA